MVRCELTIGIISRYSKSANSVLLKKQAQPNILIKILDTTAPWFDGSNAPATDLDVKYV